MNIYRDWFISELHSDLQIVLLRDDVIRNNKKDQLLIIIFRPD